LAELFAAASELAADERASFLARACAGQPTLLAELNSLLGSHERAEADGFMREEALKAEALRAAEEMSHEQRVGQLAGRYKLLALVGEGGMGEVYLAEDTRLDRSVAVKLIRSALRTRELLRRFANERQILARLGHENIARLLDVGTTGDGVPFLVMEYVEGRPVTEYCDARKLSIPERLRLFRTVCSAVQHAHQNLIVHRDLKPSNILVTADGRPKLLDFGIAKLLDPGQDGDADATATALRAMTPEYASPEQVKGEPVNTTTDVYSLGVVLYELLTGRSPYRLKQRTTGEITRAVCEQEPEQPSRAVGDSGQTGAGSTGRPRPETRSAKPLRGDLDNIVLKALRKEPQKRYASVEQFSEDIRRHLEGRPVGASRGTLTYRAAKFVRRNRVGVAATAIILLTLVGGIVATAWEAHVARAERAKAEQRFNQVRKLAHTVLFDYHDEIAAMPGSTKIRERLVSDALEYLDNLSKESTNDTSLLRELAAAYEKVAAVQGGVAASRGSALTTSNLGDTKGALESLNKALTIREKVAALEPDSKEARQELAFCLATIGELYMSTGAPDKAVESLRKATPIYEALLAVDPENETLQINLVNNYGALSKVLGNPSVPNRGDIDGALEYLNKALPIMERLAADHPTNPVYRLYVAGLHINFGWVLNSQRGKQPEALEHLQKALAIGQELVTADPSNTLYRNQLAIEFSVAGRIKLNADDERGALEDFKEALAISESLSKADPDDASTRKLAAGGYRNVAEALAATGDYPNALKSFQKAQRMYSDLVAEDPLNADSQAKLSSLCLAMSEAQGRVNDLEGAADSALQGVKIGEALVTASPTNSSARVTLAQLYSQLGASHAALAARAGAGKRAEQLRAAKDAYQKSLDIYQDMKNKGTLSAADAGKPVEVGGEIAKCEAALSR
jgi:non-specific serine/threonine protein kinase/serine/threonine-protein kinase